MKVVLDTNVVVSGTFWTGASFHVLALADQGAFTIIATAPILKEYDKIIHSEEILNKTTTFQQAQIHALYKLLGKATIVDPKEKINAIKDDPADNKFLEAAVEAHTDYIISNDKKHLLILKKFRNIPIITPETFLQQLQK